jgi:hypothetical protein
MAEQKKQIAARVHPDEQAKIEAISKARQLLQGSPQDKPQTSYYTPILIQCTLPHSDPQTRDWKKTNGDYTLIVSSGVDDNLEPYGIPYGSVPRLTLAYIITRVKATGDRRLELSANFGSFLKEIGYTGNLRGKTRASKAIQNQIIRLLNSHISYGMSGGNAEQGATISHKLDVADTVALWWDYKNHDQGSLWGSYIELDEKFYKAIVENPVPLRTDILAALKKSPLALDVYMWISYRLYTLQAAGQEQVTLSYGRLQEQFGTGISEANYRSFRRDFKSALAKVSKYWRSPNGEKELLNYELREDAFTLFRSPLLINVSKRKIAQRAAEEETAQILSRRKFDDLTMKQARQVAGNKWDVRWLEKQYFEWIEQESIAVKDLRAHFLAFIKTHRERNEK